MNRFLLEQMKEDFSELKAGFLRVGTQCETALLYKFKAHADDYLDDIDRLAETESLREAGEIFAKRHVIPREKIAEDDFKLLDLKRRLTALKESYTGLVKKYREMQFDRETDLPRYLSWPADGSALRPDRGIRGGIRADEAGRGEGGFQRPRALFADRFEGR